VSQRERGIEKSGSVVASRSISRVHLGLRKRRVGGVDGGHLGASTQVLCLLEKEENG
jgi:hypothetical protein